MAMSTLAVPDSRLEEKAFREQSYLMMNTTSSMKFNFIPPPLFPAFLSLSPIRSLAFPFMVYVPGKRPRACSVVLGSKNDIVE